MIYFYTIFRFFLQLAFHIPDVSVLTYQVSIARLLGWGADTIVGEDTRKIYLSYKYVGFAGACPGPRRAQIKFKGI